MRIVIIPVMICNRVVRMILVQGVHYILNGAVLDGHTIMDGSVLKKDGHLFLLGLKIV